jgi:hypothetical protein
VSHGIVSPFETCASSRTNQGAKTCSRECFCAWTFIVTAARNIVRWRSKAEHRRQSEAVTRVWAERSPRERPTWDGSLPSAGNEYAEQTPVGLDLHLIVDNYATHKTPAVKRWIKAHPRFHLHFTPTSASWLNMVERFFAQITRKRIRRGAFKSVANGGHERQPAQSGAQGVPRSTQSRRKGTESRDRGRHA